MKKLFIVIAFIFFGATAQAQTDTIYVKIVTENSAGVLKKVDGYIVITDRSYQITNKVNDKTITQWVNVVYLDSKKKRFPEGTECLRYYERKQLGIK